MQFSVWLRMLRTSEGASHGVSEGNHIRKGRAGREHFLCHGPCSRGLGELKGQSSSEKEWLEQDSGPTVVIQEEGKGVRWRAERGTRAADLFLFRSGDSHCAPWLACYSLCRINWPQSYRDLPTAASQVWDLRAVVLEIHLGSQLAEGQFKKPGPCLDGGVWCGCLC